MTTDLCLRGVEDEDLAVFFEQQLDPEATRMAAFRSRDREAFAAHWAKVRADPNATVRTVVYQGKVAGSIFAWHDAGEVRVGYWHGREFWGKGVASAALAQFLKVLEGRPLHARVAKHNAASVRVLQKCGFTICGEDKFTDPVLGEVEEFILTLAGGGGTK